MHVSVLKNELIEGLDVREGEVVVDGTVNGGGHAEAVCQAIGKSGTLIGIDLDAQALVRARERLSSAPCKVVLVEENFRNVRQVLDKQRIAAIDKIYFDLGLSSNQLNPPAGGSGRGFSFRDNEPLLMSFSEQSGKTAADIVNSATEKELADIIYRYGEERSSRRIAKAIVEARRKQRIITTGELAAIVTEAVPRRGKTHPATKTFQALRIAVNDELENLREGITAGLQALTPRGRMGIISFHSLEDRIVKHAFRDAHKEGKGVVLTKKPLTPSRAEVSENPRARSAKLRVFQKTVLI